LTDCPPATELLGNSATTTGDDDRLRHDWLPFGFLKLPLEVSDLVLSRL
jgi:hypothetical protein